jgi:hypothetical protein
MLTAVIQQAQAETESIWFEVQVQDRCEDDYLPGYHSQVFGEMSE